MNLKKPVFIIFIFLHSLNLYSQQMPSDTSWKYIDAGVYRIIFPEEISSAGKRVADLMLHYEPYNYSNLKTTPRFIPIVLINQGTDANGFVSIIPFYSHWYTTPSSFDGIEWFKGLAIHEGRHMVQMNRLKDGAAKKAWRVLFGDLGSLIFYGLYIPPWFMEGDAVVMETALSEGGRGRQPFFSLWQRTLELTGKRYSYYKNFLGSYDSLYPVNNHYRLGYLLCSYIQRHYGIDVWNRVLDDTGRYFLFYTFDRSLEFETGRSIVELYNDALNEYNLNWNRQLEELKFTDAEIKSDHKEDRFDSYLFPFMSTGGVIGSVRFARDKKIMLTGIYENHDTINLLQLPSESIYGMHSNERTVSAGGDKILWCETVPDSRWGYRNYSDIKLYDLKLKETVKLSSKRKFISAALSPDGKLAAGIEYTPDLRYALSLIDTTTLAMSPAIPMNGLGHVFDPAISDNNELVAMSSLSDNGNALIVYNSKSGKFDNITGFSHSESYRAPAFWKNYIIYVSDYSGIDNIYAVDLTKKKKFQVTSRKFGAYYPFIPAGSSTLLFNDYSLNGHAIASMELSPDKWTPIDQVKRKNTDTISPITDEIKKITSNDIDNIKQNEYEVNNYSPLLHSFNICGWIPYFDSTDSEFTFIMLSRDVLHTTDMYISYIHNFNENTAAGEASIIYSRYYPVISLSGGYGERAVRIEEKNETDHSTWREAKATAGIKLPLNFSRGIHNTELTVGEKTGYINITDKTREDYYIYNDINRDGILFYNEYYLTFSFINQNAPASVTKGTGTELNVSYTHTPYNTDYKGNLFSTDLAVYLPGFTDVQGLILKGSYEHLDYDNYIFPEKNLFPRGYESLRFRHFMKGSIDYAFPVFNLSFNVWKLLYFKRINGVLFFDYGAGKTENGYTYFPSAGFELTAEQNILSNLYLAIEAGFRYSYCFETDEKKYELVLKTPVY